MKLVPITFLGFAAGILSGLIGIGGGIIMIPALILFFGFSQTGAQGTTLAAMIPPIGLLATYVYYKNGDVHVATAACLAAGFFIGGYIGAKWAVGINTALLEKVFAITLIIVGIKMLFSK